MSSFPCPISAAAKNWPKTVAVISDSQSLSYNGLNKIVGQMAAHLNYLGVRRGERVAMIAPNSLFAVVLLHATIRIGAIIVPLSTRFPKEQLASILTIVGPRLIAIDNSLGLAIDSSTDINQLFKDAQSQTDAIDKEELDLDSDASIIATSGSSSEPKLAVHTLGNHIYNALGSNQNIKLERNDRWLLSLPLFHVGGLAILFRTALAASAVVIDNDRDIFSTVASNSITHVSVVPTQLKRLLAEISDGFEKNLKAVLVGGGPVSQGLMLQAMAHGLPVHASYGLTEMASQVTTTSLGANEAELLTSGRLLRHRELMIADDGEILVRGECLFKGYYQVDGSIKRANGPGFPFHTGDLGQVTPAGFLIVKGRKDNMFISGGENIHPEEIESAMLSMDMIEDVIVVPVPDAEFSARPAAFVKFGSEKIDAEGLSLRLERKLPRFKVPDYFFDWPETESVSIKPSRAELTEVAAGLI